MLHSHIFKRISGSPRTLSRTEFAISLSLVSIAGLSLLYVYGMFALSYAFIVMDFSSDGTADLSALNLAGLTSSWMVPLLVTSLMAAVLDLTTRRLRDMGWSAWHLLWLVPMLPLGFIFLLTISGNSRCT